MTLIFCRSLRQTRATEGIVFRVSEHVTRLTQRRTKHYNPVWLLTRLAGTVFPAQNDMTLVAMDLDLSRDVPRIRQNERVVVLPPLLAG
jgi:hypothetical protein